MNIEISGTYRITSDDRQIVIQRKHTIDPTKSPAFNAEKHSSEIRTEWRDWKFCGKVSQAIEIILRQNILESDATDLRSLRNEIVSFRAIVEAQLDE